MRVVFVSPFPPARDGIGTYTQAMMAALRARGHETRVVVPRAQESQSGEVLGALAPGSGQLASLRDEVLAGHRTSCTSSSRWPRSAPGPGRCSPGCGSSARQPLTELMEGFQWS